MRKHLSVLAILLTLAGCSLLRLPAPQPTPEQVQAWLTDCDAVFQTELARPVQSEDDKNFCLHWQKVTGHDGLVTELRKTPEWQQKHAPCPAGQVKRPDLTCAPPAPTYIARLGIVRTEGRSFVDDSGPFFPLGETAFWFGYGWDAERDRVRQNLEFLAKHQWDFIRVIYSLREVSEATLASLVDEAYDRYGLRTQITVWGGVWDGATRDPLELTDRVVRVTLARPHKVIFLEGANESFQNGPRPEVLDEMTRRLRATGVLTMSSSIDPANPQIGEGNIYSWHSDRTPGDLNWRFVRQAWDSKYFPWAGSQNEPIGPASSVNYTYEPSQIAAHRAVGIICGTGAYVLHNASGVGGVDAVHPGSGQRRPANLWEMRNIDAIMKAVRGIDELLPRGVESWTRTNDGWSPPNPVHPFPAQVFWPEGEHGVNKNYAARSGASWVSVPIGVRNEGTFRVRDAARIQAYDVETGNLFLEIDAEAGQLVKLPGRSDSLRAYIVRGTNR